LTGSALFPRVKFTAVYHASHSRHFAGGQSKNSAGGFRWKK
jgi:hypothetical protein